MKLCVPVTDIFKRRQVELLPLVDGLVYKAPPHDEREYPGKVALLESSLNLAACDFADQLAASGFAPALRSGKFAAFSCDLGPACRGYATESTANGFPRYVPRGDMPSAESVGRICRDNLSYLRRFFVGDIEVENLNYFPTGAYELVCEPQWIGQIVEELNVGLAIDLGHALISAQNLGVGVDSYLQHLPLECVTQLHLSSPRYINGTLEDAHEVPSASEYELVDFIARRANPVLPRRAAVCQDLW